MCKHPKLKTTNVEYNNNLHDDVILVYDFIYYRVFQMDWVDSKHDSKELLFEANTQILIPPHNWQTKNRNNFTKKGSWNVLLLPDSIFKTKSLEDT